MAPSVHYGNVCTETQQTTTEKENDMERFDELFDELVPASGKADSLAGEIARATARIGYRFYNDGDQIGIGYGKETCNPVARFLIRKLPKEIGDLATALWGMANEEAYETVLKILVDKVTEYIEGNPELKKTPTEDMFSFRAPYEDVDDEKDEDFGDYWEEEEDE